MLNSIQTDLYQRLQDFELDDPTHEFGFTRHLMKNHGWTLIQTQRIICEYKKFAFLAVVADHQVVPSDRVDQVWHAHVLLTQSYWEEFCPKVLGQKLHHHPARGGKEERAEFHIIYAKTIASYRHFFGYPPTDIWSSPDRRFGAELKMQRINISEHWVIPKKIHRLSIPNFSIIVAIFTAISIGYVESVEAASTVMGLSNPVNQLLLIIFVLPIILGISLRYWIQMPGEQVQKPQLNIYEIAYLAGSESRVMELVITKLVYQGYLRPNVQNRTFSIEKSLSSDATPLEHKIMLQVRKTPDFKQFKNATYLCSTNLLQNRLEKEQILMGGWKILIGNSFPIFLALSILAAFLLPVISSIFRIESSSIGDIILLLWLELGLLTLCCYVPSGRTSWGDETLADIRKNQDIHDVLQQFALNGDRVLSGGALDDLKQIFQDIKNEENKDAGGCGCGC